MKLNVKPWFAAAAMMLPANISVLASQQVAPTAPANDQSITPDACEDALVKSMANAAANEFAVGQQGKAAPNDKIIFEGLTNTLYYMAGGSKVITVEDVKANSKFLDQLKLNIHDDNDRLVAGSCNDFARTFLGQIPVLHPQAHTPKHAPALKHGS